jgi:hypothetical protein
MNKTFRAAGLALGAAAVAAAAALPVMTANAAPAAATATVPKCATSSLQVWLGIGAGGGAAGSTTYPLEFTNISKKACTLAAYPGVAAATAGHQDGSPARGVPSPFFKEKTWTLKPGGTVHTNWTLFDTGNFPAAKCKPVTATDLRVYPPGRSAYVDVPFSFSACSVRGTRYMTVEYIQPGTGIPGFPGIG